MKTLSGVILIVFAVSFFITGSTSLTSCKKEIKHDTVLVHDTFCDCVTGLVAYYNFRGGTLLDSSDYGNNITASSNIVPAADRNGVANNAYSFNGSSSYMSAPNSASLNPSTITLFAVVKVNGFYSGQCHGNSILMKGDQDDVQGLYCMRFGDTVNNCDGLPPNINKEFFYGAIGNNIPKGTATGAVDTLPIKTGQWYALAYTYDGKYSRFYVNGFLRSTKERIVSFTPNSRNLFIGKMENSLFPYYFNGVIDEIRIYNHALCPSAIKQLANM